MKRNTGDRRLCASGGITTKKNARMCCGDPEGDASDWKLTILNLLDMDLKYWTTQSLTRQDALLASRQVDAPVFAL